MKNSTQPLLDDLLPEELQPPMALDVFTKRIGVTATTVWRWRKDGILDTVNIYGRQYVTAKGLIKFNRRVQAGEFQREHKTPGAKKSPAPKART